MVGIKDIPIVGEALSRISEITVDAAFRQISYIFCYKANVETLKSKMEGLNNKERDVESRVQDALNNAKIIKEHVLKWQNDVKQINNQVTVFLRKNEGRVSWRCFNVMSCPNPYRRWKLGRWALKQTATVEDSDKKQPLGDIANFPPVVYTPISSTGYQDFGSRAAAYQRILEALTREENGFPVVAIYGFGGVGKTRMMEQVSKQVKDSGSFKTVARANVGQVVDVAKIQDQLAVHLNVTETHRDKAFQLKKRLSNGEKILVILDDLWEEINFEEIGIPFGDTSIKGCKILITSRLRQVCCVNKCKDPVEVEALTPDEAWVMFTDTVGTSIIQSVGESLARKVCAKCARLPLIVVAVGKALREMKHKHLWKDALHQLRNCKPENIAGVTEEAYVCLQLSFKVLDKDAYLLLLLCSLYDEDEEIRIEDLFRLATGSGLLKGWDTLDAARNRVNAVVSKLKSSSLLLQGRYESLVKLHDIIRDVARFKLGKEIEYAFFSASCDSLWPDVDDLSRPKLIKLDFKSENGNFRDNLNCPDLHTLHLDCSKMSGEQLPDIFFESFPKLKCLYLYIKSLSALPSSLQKCKRLSSLTIKAQSVKDINLVVELKNLEMLALDISDFEGVLPDLRRLRGLRMLELRGVIEITQDVLSGLLNLEELYLKGRRMRLSSSSALSELRRLNNLEIDLEDFKSCPDENICKKLGRYKISVGGEYDEYDIAALRRCVELKDCSIEGGAKTLVERAEEVRLVDNVKGIQNCFSQGGVGGGAFTHLKYLDISRCRKEEEEEYVLGGMMSPITLIHQPQQHLPSFSNLTYLSIVNSGFKYAFSFSVATCLPQLEFLTIIRCEKMEEIVRYEGHQTPQNDSNILSFPKLRHLRLEQLPAFKYVFSFSVATCLPQLEDLWICMCEKMEEIVRYEGHQTPQNDSNILSFPKLRHLLLGWLPALKSFCGNGRNTLFDGKVVFPALKDIRLWKLDSVSEIWEEQGHPEDSFCQVEVLLVGSCDQLKNVIPYPMGQRFQSLHSIDVRDCDSLKEIIASVGEKTATDDTCEEIFFPQLLEVMLQKLRELKHFSSSPHYSLKMPLVHNFEVLKCSEFMCFTPAEIMSSPMVHIEITYPRPDEQLTAVCKDSLANINNYLQQPRNTQDTTWFDEYKKLHPEAELKS